jgi:hypothetical protein
MTEIVLQIHKSGQKCTSLLSTDHELIPAGCTRPQCSAGGVQSKQVDGRLPIGQRYGDAVIHSLTANIG